MSNTADMRTLARQLFAAAVEAADPALAVRRHLTATPPAPLPAGGKYLVLAIGKAAPAMLREALAHLPSPVVALGVTHHENRQDVAGATILTAGHPVPDQAGFDAARRILSLLGETTKYDRVLALISGGGSALVPAPIAPLTLADKQAVSQVLLDSGLDIVAMNMVRQQLSEIKGGGLLRHAAPAPVTALILSDVIGDDLRAIASGPTVAPLGSREDVVALLKEHRIFNRIPDEVQALLQSPDTRPAPPEGKNHLVGSNRQSLDAMFAALPSDWHGEIVSDRLTGDVKDAAATIIDAARNCRRSGPTALIFGGETTVQITGTGRGGRNQELALRVALEGADLPEGWVFLSGGTDGRDGPTDAAGGIVDGGSAARMAAADPEMLLANNDSNAALATGDDLLITGATGTNVADVQVLLLP
ncbi:glycerate kinase [Sulfitobacter aestuarii]|uniref:Glycerate kinase n=1 Tax=Sulfitobacter aestuarii TaxID=2161676 RepID=A0ABW5TXP7_9RHOB